MKMKRYTFYTGLIVISLVLTSCASMRGPMYPGVWESKQEGVNDPDNQIVRVELVARDDVGGNCFAMLKTGKVIAGKWHKSVSGIYVTLSGAEMTGFISGNGELVLSDKVNIKNAETGNVTRYSGGVVLKRSQENWIREKSRQITNKVLP